MFHKGRFLTEYECANLLDLHIPDAVIRTNCQAILPIKVRPVTVRTHTYIYTYIDPHQLSGHPAHQGTPSHCQYTHIYIYIYRSAPTVRPSCPSRYAQSLSEHTHIYIHIEIRTNCQAILPIKVRPVTVSTHTYIYIYIDPHQLSGHPAHQGTPSHCQYTHIYIYI